MFPILNLIGHKSTLLLYARTVSSRTEMDEQKKTMIVVNISALSDSKVPYPYLLEADHHAYAGHVAHDARHGERVAAEVEEAGGHEKAEEAPVLRVRFQLRAQQPPKVSKFVIYCEK